MKFVRKSMTRLIDLALAVTLFWGIIGGWLIPNAANNGLVEQASAAAPAVQSVSITPSGSPTPPTAPLKAGDADNNVINMTDFNNDGVTNTSDFNLLNGNFAQTGQTITCP